MPLTLRDARFASLGKPRRLWAISAIHGETERLIDLHNTLFEYIEPGDRLIYHGNYLGHGPTPSATIDEILTFRRMVMALPGMVANDLVYLRGGQEEMWQKLLQIQFAPNPTDVLLWMLDNGMASTIEAYGMTAQDALTAALEGVMGLTRWTGRIKESVRRKAGHEIFASHWRRAAYIEAGETAVFTPLLFVNAGIDPARALTDQGDSFWWAGKHFNSINVPYAPFQKVIRGFDPAHGGLHINCVTATIDGGCGFGGGLVCAGFGPDGEIFDLIEA